MSLVAEILSAPHTFAVVGVSQDPARYGHEVFDAFIANGQRAFPINPKYQSIDGHSCYSSLDTLPEMPDVVVTVVPPAVTEKVAETCVHLGISTLWMTPGTESEPAIAFCTANGVQVIHGFCPVFVLKLPKDRWQELP